MRASIVLAVAALAAAAGAAQAQLTAPGGAQPGMQADGEGRSAVPLVRAVRQPDTAPRTAGQPAGAANPDTGPGRSSEPAGWRWVWQKGPFLEAANLDGSRSAVGASAGDNTAYPSR